MMKSRKSSGRFFGRSFKEETQPEHNARHSSPVLGSLHLSGRSTFCESSEIANKSQQSVKLKLNRSSNGSDISVPGHGLQTDSGISSSDSLAGGEKRSNLPAEQDFVSELLKIADLKLATLSSSGNSSYNDKENDDIQTSKHLLPTSSSIRRRHVILPVTDSTASTMTMPTSTVFVTAMDTDLQKDENEFRLGDIDTSYQKESQNHTDIGDARLHCSFCGEVFSSPRLLPCLHTFCTECLKASLCEQNQKTSSRSAKHENVSDDESSSQWLTCPTCSAIVNLQLEGVCALPVNYMIERLLVLYNLKFDNGTKLTSCGLCPDNSNIEARCMQCGVNMCQFCSQAHKRQSLTAAHTVVYADAVEEGRQANFPEHRSRKLSVPIMCQIHTGEELRLYCTDCSQLVCRDCCLGSMHKDHRCEYLNHVTEQKASEITNEFKRCEAKIKSLQTTIMCLQQSEKIVDDISEEIAEKIEKHIVSYIRTLERHKNTLLSKVRAMAKVKREAVQAQKDNLSKILKDLSHSCEFTTQLLNEGSSHEILAMKSAVLQRLKNLSQIPVAENPISVDNFMEFKANRKVKTWIDGDIVFGVADSKRSSKLLRPGLEVDICGDVMSRAVEPKNCIAHGEGVHCSRVKLPSEFIIVTKNFEGEKLEIGGHDVSVSMRMEGVDSNLFKKPKVQISDRQDGTYRVLYIVHAAGNYSLDVRISGEQIYGSSFRIAAVDSMSHIHSGMFHCCCFCSSGGDKNSTCACGSIMPGGYKGCGHGHKGHPGTAHWSCCGKSTEASSCGNHNRVPVRASPNPDIPLRSLTLPTHRNVVPDVSRQATTGSGTYATSRALRSQRGTFKQPQYYDDAQQSVSRSPLFKQVKTVTL